MESAALIILKILAKSTLNNVGGDHKLCRIQIKDHIMQTFFLPTKLILKNP